VYLLCFQCEIHELLALVYYDSLQNVVPFYDQRSVLPLKDAAWTAFCESSMKHFKKAFALKYVLLSCAYFMRLSGILTFMIHFCSFTGKIGCMHFTWVNLAKSLNIRMTLPYHITINLLL